MDEARIIDPNKTDHVLPNFIASKKKICCNDLTEHLNTVRKYVIVSVFYGNNIHRTR